MNFIIAGLGRGVSPLEIWVFTQHLNSSHNLISVATWASITVSLHKSWHGQNLIIVPLLSFLLSPHITSIPPFPQKKKKYHETFFVGKFTVQLLYLC